MRKIIIALFLCLLIAGTVTGFQQEGYASWYGGRFHGRLTANGERFNTNDLTAAHKTLPFNTIVEVTNLENGRSVIVRINDRGPFVEGRIIDLSRAAADEINMTGSGIARVRVEAVSQIQEDDVHVLLQVGAYSDSENARVMFNRLISLGLTPEYEYVSNGIIRIILPDIPEQQVSRISATLTESGFPSPLVRSEQ
ncbi:MAG: septal ring lytic transglycosylase RlpA family protein [Spirochaetia bacterium]